MKKREPKKIKKRVVHKRQYIPETMILDTIINVPLHPETGHPIMKKLEVEERKKVHKGWHMFWRAIIPDGRGGIKLREVLA